MQGDKTGCEAGFESLVTQRLSSMDDELPVMVHPILSHDFRCLPLRPTGHRQHSQYHSTLDCPLLSRMLGAVSRYKVLAEDWT